MMFRFALVLALLPLALPLAACGMSYTLDESEGIDAARTAFIRHAIYPTSTRPLGPVHTDEADVSFTVDGWSLADKLGFEYVSEGDPDFAALASDPGGSSEQPRMQAAVDEALVAEPGVHVLVIRTWGHETYELARDQLVDYVDAWVSSQGR
jgi:hypothetical protein